MSFFLSPDGTVSDVKHVKSSGDDHVDAAALKVPTSGADFQLSRQICQATSPRSSSLHLKCI
ncbi:energy transducer TonB [Brucella pituitosa]|uniref:energy transducer TonB n=1 Tax=Brucella pituitosa TaxID=571256 RepID=UPI003C75BD0A